MWGQAVRAKREAKGLSQVQLAELVGTDQPDISRIELGKQLVIPTKGIAIARALGVTYDELFSIPEDEAS